jgi:two-component system, NtrC family, sensor kinase
MSSHTRFSTLARAVAQGAHPSGLLVELHRAVVASLQASASLMLQRRGRSGSYGVTSSVGVDAPAGYWLEQSAARRLQTLTGESSRMCEAEQIGPILGRLAGPDRTLVVPLTGTGSTAFLIVIAPSLATSEAIAAGESLRVQFGLALELARLGREASLHREIQELLLRFSRGISSTLSVAGALASLSTESNALFGTERSSVWLHDRRNRELICSAASTDDGLVGTRVPTDSDTHAARGLRLGHPQSVESPSGRVLVAPLRGWRRALGTLVIEGDPGDLDEQQFVSSAHELARQLSVSIENVQLLEEFLQQRRLLEDTFNSLVDLVVVVDASLQVVQMNGAFAARVNQPPGSVLGQPLASFISTELAEWLAADMAPRPREAGVASGATRQFTDPRLGGIFAVTVTPLINQDAVPIGRVVVARDITAQTELEIEREALSRRLAQSERLASLGQFVAGIAHEMNNPLQGVLGHLELLIRASEEARAVRPTLRRIYTEADRAAKIVRNLLVFTGSRRLTKVRLRVDRMLSRAFASRAAALRLGGIEVVRSQEEDVPSVDGDALLLQQALLNILINAEHAAKAAGGPGRIETSITASKDRSRVLVSICDSGPGIAADALPHIFDPFFTTKGVGQGTGLGLTITYGIVQEHGGTIHVRNRPAAGAEFTIELPAASTAPGPARTRSRRPVHVRKAKTPSRTPPRSNPRH